MVEALLAGDWKSAAEGYAEDAVRLPPGAGEERGRAAIQASLAQMARPSAITLRGAEVEGCGDLAYGWFTFSITWPPMGTEKAPGYSGRDIVIFRKQLDGRWLATRVIFNSDKQ
jgi:ketosteroid isomerase-like protein